MHFQGQHVHEDCRQWPLSHVSYVLCWKGHK
nr:MAG TPA: hypothetical protein [Caudoviricetes sp.]